ncbi:hypothetical protein HZS_4130, partial [Henneguya salminicola]
YSHHIKNILNTHRLEIDCTKAIHYLSQYSKIASVTHFLHYFHFKCRKIQILSSMSYFLNEKCAFNEYQQMNILSSSKAIKVGEDDYCELCGANFTDSVVLCKDNGKCFHTYCSPNIEY